MYEFTGCHADEEHLNPDSSPIQDPSSSNCWILMQSNDGSDDQFFNPDWSSYREGFGDASGNFWIGNKHLHQMTQLLNQGLQFAAYLTKGLTNIDLSALSRQRRRKRRTNRLRRICV